MRRTIVAFVLIVAGWMIAPAWFVFQGTTPSAPYVAGLATVAAGGVARR